MYYIKDKNGNPKATNDPDEVTKENFLVEPGAENKVWCKLEQWGHGEEPGTKVHVVNQVRADNPGDFERYVTNWKKHGMIITMLYDPREGMNRNDVATKLAKLKASMSENQNENGEGPTEEDWQKTVEAKEMAEKRAAELEAELAEMKAKAEAEAKAAFEAQEKAKAEAAEKAKAEAEANAKTAESKETKGKTK